MTAAEIKRAEKNAEGDAEELALLLLIAFKKRDSGPAKEVTWDAAVGRFRYRGRLVSFESIRKYLIRIEERLGRRLGNLTLQLERGEISLAAWQREFERTITSAHILSGALALGGIAVAVRNETVLNRIDAELVYADKFVTEIRQEKAGSINRIRARARRYMQAAHITFQQAEQKARQAVGIQKECRRILRASESCRPCLELSQRGWIPIDEMPSIGTLPKSIGGCEIYCRCYLEYR